MKKFSIMHIILTATLVGMCTELYRQNETKKAVQALPPHPKFYRGTYFQDLAPNKDDGERDVYRISDVILMGSSGYYYYDYFYERNYDDGIYGGGRSNEEFLLRTCTIENQDFLKKEYNRQMAKK